MLKIKKNTSASISLVLAILALAALAAILVSLPFIVRYYLNHLNNGHSGRLIPVLSVLYIASLPVAAADILLIRLLLLVRAGRVFSPEAVGSLRGISWCCFIEGVFLFCVSIILFRPMALDICMLAFAAAFLGVVLRVVKNVIEEATAIKSENDFTI